MPLSTDIVAELTWRGMLNQVTDERIGEFLREKPRVIYTGFDPTGPSLHVGHLVAVMNLRRFQRAGHRPIALIGGATGMIGDPSGKSAERQLLTAEAVAENVRSLKGQMSTFLDFDEKDGALLLNNYDWMSGFSYLDFLRDVGKHFPVNVMLTKDSVKSRLAREESGLSYTEFSYMLLQSYDFVYLNRHYGCEVQAGGSDQWGNITAGIDLARRMASAVSPLYGLTCALLTKSDGQKMGKTESGAVWLDPNRTSPYQFYQYWVNTDDADVAKVLRFFSDLGEEQINELLAEHEKDRGKRLPQKQVASELTALVHGPQGLAAAERATSIFFGAEISQLDDAQLVSIFSDVPSASVTRARLEEGISLIDALVMTHLAPSKGEARRTIQQGGAYINNRQATEIDRCLTAEDRASESVIVLRSGRKRYALLRLE